MRDLQRIRELARQMQGVTDAPWPTGDVDDDVSDAWLHELESAGRWIRTRTTQLGMLRPDADECRLLLGTEEGRRLAEDLAEDLDLSALYDEAASGDRATLEDARKAMRSRVLGDTALPTIVPVLEVRTAMTATERAVPVRTDGGAAIVGKDALIAAQIYDARVSRDGLLVALGHVLPRKDASPATPALVLVGIGGLADVRVEELSLEPVQALATAAVVEPKSYPGWPALSRADAAWPLWDQRRDIDELALRALRSIKEQRFSDAYACIDAIGCGESEALDSLAGILRDAVRSLEASARD